MMVITVNLWQLALIIYSIIGLVGCIVVFSGESVGAVKFSGYGARMSTLMMILFLWPFFVYLSIKSAAMMNEYDENSPEND